jgi:hypothetical protein
MRRLTLACIVVCAAVSVIQAQNYRCDWSVNGIGGGEMASSAHKCGSTVGQTAAGQLTGTSYWALIGFWQTEGQVGVREQAYSPNQGPLVTHLYSPFPTPFVRGVAIRYSLAAEGRVTLRVHDLAGRVVRTLANGVMRPGRYSLSWNGADDRGRELARGVYFCRFTAGDYRATEKLVLQR